MCDEMADQLAAFRRFVAADDALGVCIRLSPAPNRESEMLRWMTRFIAADRERDEARAAIKDEWLEGE